MFCLSVSAVFAVDSGIPFHLTAPPRPAVAPDIPAFGEMDKDRNRLDDRLDSTLTQARKALALETDPAKKGSLQATLAAPTRVEFVFSRQITQKQIDDFLNMGGTIDHIYQAVSYGWNGSIPLGSIESFRASMGDSLVGIVGEKEVRACMDEASRTGRVRPVWVPGFAGNAGGISGSSTTTIDIMDTGVDDLHTDLAGRMEFWKDYTSAHLASPADVNGHGSHVAGIAFGSGNSAGAATTTLSYTDSGDLTGVPSGSFYPSPIHLPNSSMTFTSTATWLGKGTASLDQVYQANGSTAGYYAVSSAASGGSPITEANTFTGSLANQYSAALLQGTPAKITKYVVANTVTNYPGVGDGYNKLGGVAPGCRWAGSRVLSDSGSGTSSNINTALDDAVVQRVAHNIKIVSMSFGINGTPGIDTTQRAKVNTLVNNGIIALVAAGNDGPGTAGANVVDDPGHAGLAITVGASNDINQLTEYTSSGFASPGSDEDYKPDLLAPGGSAYYSMILSVDSNDGDAGGSFSDQQTNDYRNIMGTSMSTPFAAGTAALVIQALESQGLSWSFSSSTHPLLVKMLLCATSTETNSPREVATGTDPTLGRAASPKDLYEGYGILNPDAAVEAASLTYAGGSLSDGTAGGFFDRRAWARKVVLAAGGRITVSLTVPGTGDYDLYLYSGSPDSKGNPVIRASSTNTASGASESIDYTSASGETLYMVIKRVSGNGNWTLTGTAGNCTAPSITGQPSSQTVCSPNTATFAVTATGTAPTYQWRDSGGSISGATNSSYTTGTAGSYYCVVTNTCGSDTSNTATLTVNTAPAITSQPSSQTVYSPSTGTFTVTATSVPDPTYQWYGTSGAIVGATGASYNTGTAGSYYCVATNGCGSVTSDSATLTVRRGIFTLIKALGRPTSPPNPVTVAGRVTSTSPLNISDGSGEITITGLTANLGDFLIVTGDLSGQTISAATWTVYPGP